MYSDEVLNIAFCIDRMHFVGLIPALRSIVQNTGESQVLAFHITVGAGESDELLAMLRRAFPAPDFRYTVKEFNVTPFLDDYIRAGREMTYAAYTSSVMNFSRFYLADIYPDLGKFAYLDVDIIVQGDIAELFRLATLEQHDLAAVPFNSFGGWTEGFKNQDYIQDLDPMEPVFNAGVYVTELAKWQTILPQLEHWMQLHRQSMDDVVFGTQSIMNLAFYKNLQVLPQGWNLSPMGHDETFPESELRQANLLHWAGQKKPWRPQGLYKEYWRPYAQDLTTATEASS